MGQMGEMKCLADAGIVCNYVCIHVMLIECSSIDLYKHHVTYVSHLTNTQMCIHKCVAKSKSVFE